MTKCDFCGKEGKWKNILRTTDFEKTDGSDIVLCNECIEYYMSHQYDKIKLRGEK